MSRVSVSKNRIQSFDVCKGISIIAIIVGHSVSGPLRTVLFSFHIPIFFLISGYFYKQSKEYATKHISSLVRSYFNVALIMALLSFVKIFLFEDNATFLSALKGFGRWIVAAIYGSGSRNNLFGIKIPIVGAIWFWLALSWALGIVFLVNRQLEYSIKDDRRLTFISCLIYAALYVISIESARYIWLPFSIQSGLMASFFLFLGSKLKYWHPRNKFVGIIICLFLWVVDCYYSFSFGDISVASCTIPMLFINTIGAVAGSQVVFFLSQVIDHRTIVLYLKRYLVFIGQNTMIVLTVHMMEYWFIPWQAIKNTYSISNWIIVIVKILLISILTMVYIIIKAKVDFKGRNLSMFRKKVHK